MDKPKLVGADGGMFGLDDVVSTPVGVGVVVSILAIFDKRTGSNG